MRELDESIRKKHINSLRLLGVSDSQMTKLTGKSIATVKRSSDSLCKSLDTEDEQQLLSALHKAKHRVKGTEFARTDNREGVEGALDRALSTDSRKYLVLIWFGNVHKQPCNYDHLYDDELGHRFINPKSFRWGTEGAQHQTKRLQNLALSLSLMGWSQEEIDEFCQQVASPLTPQSKTSSPESGQDQPNRPILEPQPHSNFDLLRIAPRLPAKRKQKDKKRLIKFVCKHLERCEGNFIYAERFTRAAVIPDDVKLEDMDEDQRRTWWVFGPRDILDWFECHEV